MNRFILFSLYYALLLAISFLWRRLPIDDAYITYRYALQVLGGNGLVYNIGEAVLGTTTPLWALILALLHFLGFDIEAAAVFGGSLASLLLVLLFMTRVSSQNSVIVKAIWMVFIALYYPISVVTFSGMETSLYSLVVGVGLYQLASERPMLGALCGVLATLLRPDGFLVVVVGVINFLFHNVKAAGKCLALYLTLLLPILLLCHSTYGSVLPHSIEAKRILYPAPLLKNIFYFFEALSQTPIDAIVMCFGIAGLIFAGSISRLRVYALWGGFYSIGIVVSGVKPIFFWYFGPLWLLFLTIGIEGLVVRAISKGAFERIPKRILLAITAGVFVAMSLDTFSRASGLDEVETRENGYREIVSEYGPMIPVGDRVLVGETGILGFGLLQANIIDSSGINSPRVSQLLRALRSEIGPYEDFNRRSKWLERVIAKTEPQWIIGARNRMQLSLYENEAWFSSKYEMLKVVAPRSLGGVAVFRKRDTAQGENENRLEIPGKLHAPDR